MQTKVKVAVGMAIVFAGLALLMDMRAQEARQPVPKLVRPEVDDEKLYVLQQVPERGLQSVLILDVVDGGHLNVAFLSPARITLKTPGDKAALEKLLHGKLLTLDLQGRGKDGLPISDVHLGAKNGWLSEMLKKEKP